MSNLSSSPAGARQADRRPAGPAGDAVAHGRTRHVVHRQRRARGAGGVSSAAASPPAPAALRPRAAVPVALDPRVLRLLPVPDGGEPLLLVHELRPAVVPALGRARELPLPAHEDPLFWQSVRNTLWIIVIGVPLRLAFAIFTAMLLTAPRRGVKLYRTLFYLPTLAPPVAAVLAFVVLLNPENGPRRPGARHRGRCRRRSGSRIPPTRSGASCCSAVGGRRRDDHHARRPARRAAQPVRGGGHRGRQRLAQVPATSRSRCSRP